MRSIFPFLFILFFHPASSQVYVPLPVQNVQWNCTFTQGWFNGMDHGYETDEMAYVTSGDTVIGLYVYCKLTKSTTHISGGTLNGQSYSYSIFQGTNYCGCFRNDSLNRKVYFLPADSTNEKLLYDFSLHTGDTVQAWWNNYYSPMMNTILIEAEDSVLIGSIYRRRLGLTPTGSGTGYLIEGIGSTFGLLNPVEYFENYGNLDCFSINNQTMYPDSSTNCELIDKTTALHSEDSFSLYPNPAHDLMSILTKGVQNKTISCEIMNYTGALLSSFEFIPGNKAIHQIDLSNYSPGVYFIFLKTEKSFQVRKFIRE